MRRIQAPLRRVRHSARRAGVSAGLAARGLDREHRRAAERRVVLAEDAVRGNDLAHADAVGFEAKQEALRRAPRFTGNSELVESHRNIQVLHVWKVDFDPGRIRIRRRRSQQQAVHSATQDFHVKSA